MTTINAGNVVGLLKSETGSPPTKTYVLWGEITNPLTPDVVVFRYYDGATWQKLVQDTTTLDLTGLTPEASFVDLEATDDLLAAFNKLAFTHANALLQGGNSFAADIIFGTNDTNTVAVKVDGNNRVTLGYGDASPSVNPFTIHVSDVWASTEFIVNALSAGIVRAIWGSNAEIRNHSSNGLLVKDTNASVVDLYIEKGVQIGDTTNTGLELIFNNTDVAGTAFLYVKNDLTTQLKIANRNFSTNSQTMKLLLEGHLYIDDLDPLSTTNLLDIKKNGTQRLILSHDGNIGMGGVAPSTGIDLGSYKHFKAYGGAQWIEMYLNTTNSGYISSSNNIYIHAGMIATTPTDTNAKIVVSGAYTGAIFLQQDDAIFFASNVYAGSSNALGFHNLTSGVNYDMATAVISGGDRGFAFKIQSSSTNQEVFRVNPAKEFLFGFTTGNIAGVEWRSISKRSGTTVTGYLMNQTLTAAANGDTLAGLTINPVFSAGAFTGLTEHILRLQNNGSDMAYINEDGSYESTDSSFLIKINASVASGDALFEFNDNKANALEFTATDTLTYMIFRTTDNDEAIELHQTISKYYGSIGNETKSYRESATTADATPTDIWVSDALADDEMIRIQGWLSIKRDTVGSTEVDFIRIFVGAFKDGAANIDIAGTSKFESNNGVTAATVAVVLDTTAQTVKLVATGVAAQNWKYDFELESTIL